MASAVVRHLQLERHRWAERLSGPGWTLPNFMREPALAPLHALSTHPPLLSALEQAAGGAGTFRYCGSDDVGVNRRVAWHRDLLPPHPWRFAHVRQPMWGPWEEGPSHGFEMVTAAVYLQDHSAGSDSLTVSRGSHLSGNCSTRQACRQGLALRPRKGDVVVFDRRLMHRGSKRPKPPAASSGTNGSSPRGLVSLCFGRRNALTDTFERGAEAYQDELVTVRAPLQAFIRASASAHSARRREWDGAFDQYVGCLGRASSESEQRALAVALAARQADAATAYGQRIVGKCVARHLPPELRSRLAAHSPLAKR